MGRSSIQLKRKNNPIAVVFKAEALTKYIFLITNNDNVFPKRYRYDLVQKLHNTSLELETAIIEAVNMKPKFRKEIKKKIKKIEYAIDQCRHLGALMIITNSIITLKNPEEYARLYADLTKSLQAYYSNTKAKFNTYPTKKEYYKKRKHEYLQYKITKLNNIASWNDSYYRDSDGFYMLIKKL